MSDYVKSTNFAIKDSLVTTDPAKVIKGTDLDNEFNALANAIASKANTNSPSLTGTPTAPTATTGSNTNQLATTAFVTSALQGAYPVGSVYINATNSANPATLLGFGTWTAFGAGRMPVGFDASNALFDSAEETGGSSNAIVVTHTHTATSVVTDPGHSHTLPIWGSSSGTGYYTGNYANPINTPDPSGTSTTGISVETTNSTTGSSGTNANIPPYITVYMWKRTA